MSYTVSAGGKIRLGETDKVASVLQNVAVILATPRGSVPLYRDFGLPQNAVDRPVNIAQGMLRAQIKEAVETFEPRAEVVGVSFEQDEDSPGALRPIVEVNIIE